MNSVFFPVQVVGLWRRLRVALSSLSTSTQYVHRVQDLEDSAPKESTIGTDQPEPETSWASIEALCAVEWPWWTCGDSWGWLTFSMTEAARDNVQDVIVHQADTLDTMNAAYTKSVSIDGIIKQALTDNTRWLSHGWSWPKVSLASTTNLTCPGDEKPCLAPACKTGDQFSRIRLPWIGTTFSLRSFVSFSIQVTSTENSGQQEVPTRNGGYESRQSSEGSPPPPNNSPPPSPSPPPPQYKEPAIPEPEPDNKDVIHLLLQNPALYDPIRIPRFPIVLCHGLYGFDVKGPSSFPSLRMHYWSNVLSTLQKKVGADVIVTSVPGTGSILSRATILDKQLQTKARGRGVNFLAHSMGGLDCRHLISHIKPTEYVPLSLTTISTPHRGSPFMDWCAENLGIGKIRQKEELSKAMTTSTDAPTLSPHPSRITPSSPEPPSSDSSGPKQKSSSPSALFTSLPSSFTTMLLSLVDSPAYANLTSSYLTDTFNPATPNDEKVKYFSVAGRLGSVGVWHPFWLPKMVLDGVEERSREQMRKDFEQGRLDQVPDVLRKRMWEKDEEWGNDGLVTVQSANWGEFLGIMEGCDHWEMRGARGIAPELPPLGKVSLGLPLGKVDLSLNLGVGDWGRLVRAWKRENSRTSLASASGGDEDQRKRERDHHDADMKSSTDRLSAVVDWLVEQVPAPPKLKTGEERVIGVKEDKRKEKRNELGTKEGLERFYIALSKKLWDEGL